MNELLYYREALRLGQKEYRSCVAKGVSPCLPILDDFIPPEKTSTAGVDLGLVQIPTELIVGTKSRGRVNAFAPNFMPIMKEATEFSVKWEALCRAHLSEGIRDAITAYEYMNRYYVEEGNKRVSVLKFFGAVTIPGKVIRILPERNGDPETEIYYEFLSFYKLSQVNFIEFSKKGGYAALQLALGKKVDESWTEDERRHFSSAYYYFRRAYSASGGDKLSSTVGDALLSYIQIYGYASLSSAGETQIRKNLAKMWEEVALQQDKEPIELKLGPAEEKKPGLLASVLPSAPAVRKVAFIYDKSPEVSGWVHGHELGRQHVQRVFDGKIETCAYPDAMEGDPNEVLERAIAEGNTLLFTTSPRLMQASLRAAVEHPDTVIMNCSLNKSHRYIRSYYARMYEAKFIIGAIAGSLTESGRLGYVCDYPIFGQIAGINAFALGAQMTNPRAKVYLEWSSVKGLAAATESLKAQDIHLISAQDTAMALTSRSGQGFGLSCIHGDEMELLAAPVCRWGTYYEGILRQMLSKNVQSEYESSSKALNYYWGMSAGVVDVEYSDSLTEGTRRLADFLKTSICREVCNPFLTPLRTQSGRLIGGDSQTLSQEQISGMDYLVDNVIGSIPVYEELSPIGQATVDTAGVEPATAGAEETEKE